MTVELIGVGEAIDSVAMQIHREFRADPRTVKKFVLGLDLLRLQQLGAEEDLIAMAQARFDGAGGTDRYLIRLGRAYEFHYWVHPAHAGSPEFRRHWADLQALTDQLATLGTWHLRDYDLANFALFDGDSWGFPGGRIHRGADGALRVEPEVERASAWEYLTRQFDGLAIWKALDAWRSAAPNDVTARLALLREVTVMVRKPQRQGGAGLRVPSYAHEASRGLSYRYVFELYLQVFMKWYDFDRPDKHRADFFIEMSGTKPSGTVRLDGSVIGQRLTKPTLEKAITFFLRNQTQLARLPEADSAVNAYRLAEQATAHVRDALEELRASLGEHERS